MEKSHDRLAQIVPPFKLYTTAIGKIEEEKK